MTELTRATAASKAMSDTAEIESFTGSGGDTEVDDAPDPGASREEVLEDIRRLSRRLGRAPKTHEYTEQGSHPYSAVVHHFASWVEAVDAALN